MLRVKRPRPVRPHLLQRHRLGTAVDAVAVVVAALERRDREHVALPHPLEVEQVQKAAHLVRRQ